MAQVEKRRKVETTVAREPHVFLLLTTSPSGLVSAFASTDAPRRAGYLPYESEEAWQDRKDPDGAHRRHYGGQLSHCLRCGGSAAPYAQYCGYRGWQCDAADSDDGDAE